MLNIEQRCDFQEDSLMSKLLGYQLEIEGTRLCFGEIHDAWDLCTVGLRNTLVDFHKLLVSGAIKQMEAVTWLDLRQP